MRECAHLTKAKQPRNLGDMQLGIIEVTNRQVVPQLLKYWVKFNPSSESFRASVLSLIPRLRATSSTSTFPWGSTDAMAFSTLVRNWLVSPLLSASAASQYFTRRSLR